MRLIFNLRLSTRTPDITEPTRDSLETNGSKRRQIQRRKQSLNKLYYQQSMPAYPLPYDDSK